MTEEGKTAEQRRGPGRPRKVIEEPHAIIDGVLGLDPAFRPPALDLDELAAQLSEPAQEPEVPPLDPGFPKVVIPVEATAYMSTAPGAGYIDPAGTFGVLTEPERADTPSPEPYDPLREWATMDTARRDGRPIWLTDGNGKTVEAVWRHSKQFTMKADATGRLVSRWYTHNFWAINNAGGQKVPWEPMGGGRSSHE